MHVNFDLYNCKYDNLALKLYQNNTQTLVQSVFIQLLRLNLVVELKQ